MPEFWEDCHQSGSATIDDNMKNITYETNFVHDIAGSGEQ